MNLILMEAGTLLFILCIVIWYFTFRKVKRRDPWWKWGLAFFILGGYGVFLWWDIKQQLGILLRAEGGYMEQSLGMTSVFSLIFLLPILTVIVLIVSILCVCTLEKTYLLKHIIIYALIGGFLSGICALNDNYKLITGDRYIIYYIRSSGEDFDLERAKELTRDPNIKTTDGVPLLPLAIGYEKYDYADYLISIGADVDFYGEYGEWLTERSQYWSDEIEQYIESRGLRQK